MKARQFSVPNRPVRPGLRRRAVPLAAAVVLAGAAFAVAAGAGDGYAAAGAAVNAGAQPGDLAWG